MMFEFLRVLLWIQCLAHHSDINSNAAMDEFTFPMAVEGRITHSTALRPSARTLRRPRHNTVTPSDCVLPNGHHPCLLKPSLRGVPTQTVMSEGLTGREYRIHMEAEERSVVYLPCNTLQELRNETVIWDHNMSTIAVMGTLFTMDTRLDVPSLLSNRFHRCSHPASPASTSASLSGDFFHSGVVNPGDIVETWELVIEGLQMRDGGAYHCRLTGKQPQSLFYYLSVIIKVDAPRYVRRQSSANFTCSMHSTHDQSSRIILDWYRTHPRHRGRGDHQLIESQAWNNVSVYKEILGDSRDGLRLDAVMQICSADYQHTGVYECQAHHIEQNERSRVYDLISVDFTVLPRWQYQWYVRTWSLCPQRTPAIPPSQEDPQPGLSRVVLSDSPTEKLQGQMRSERQWFRRFPTKNWTLFTQPRGLISAATSPLRRSPAAEAMLLLLFIFSMIPLL